MWNEPFELLLVHHDWPQARMLAELWRANGFAPQLQSRLGTQLDALISAPPDFLILIYPTPDSIDLPQMKKLVGILSATCTLVLLEDDLQSYEESLQQAGVRLVLPMRLGARQITQTLAHHGMLRHLEQQNLQLRQMLDSRTHYEGLIGGSAPMRALYRLLDQVIRADAPVLITGEEGTEKLDVARAIHQRSPRSADRFVLVNCADDAENGENSTIFGPKGRGEYGSGPSARNSAFARAGKGSIVLDRIEKLPMPVQQRLLDFLHRPFFQNESSLSPQPVARIMATAGPNLLGEVEAGRFHRELFYRLNILQVRIPPLRERREDILLLAQYALRTCANGAGSRNGHQGLSLSSRALLQLFQHPWPGNVDELFKVIRDAVEAAGGTQIEPEDLPGIAAAESETAPAPARTNGRSNIPLKEAKRLFETEYFRTLLKTTGGNMTLASRYSRVGRPYLYKKMRECGILPDQFR